MFVERSDRELVEMTQQGFESEDLFQELLGKHPALIPDDQTGTQSPRRWLLLAREAGIPWQEGESQVVTGPPVRHADSERSVHEDF